MMQADGPIEIIAKGSQTRMKVRFTETGSEVFCTYQQIKAGTLQDPYKHSDGSKAYAVWSSMMNRVGIVSGYLDCSVHEDWLNYHNFKEWHNIHYFEGAQLDKDIKVEGNRVYGPDTCLYVTPTQNIRKAVGNKEPHFLLDPQGAEHLVLCYTEFAEQHNLNPRSLSRLCRGLIDEHKGWSLYE